MSHGIEENDMMFSVKERPWHGLGKIVQEAPTISEAIQLANLGWTVSLHELTTDNGIKLGKQRAIIRDDINECLGVLTESYKPLQNIDAFDFFQEWLDNDMATLETAGSLFNGKRVFITAKMNSENLRVSDEDQIEKYILLSNSHDGSQALKVGFVCVRVCCANTLNFAISDKRSSLISIYHKGDMNKSVEDIRNTMDLINAEFNTTCDKYKYLATRGNIDTRSIEKYVKAVFDTSSINKIIEEHEAQQQDEVEKTRKKLLKRVEEIFELEPVHNAWTLYNSVNYYLNHERGKSLDTRYNSMWFGNSKRYDLRAVELATKMF